MGRLVVRVDGGPEIGFGHLVRTSALVEHAIDEGWIVDVATTTPATAATVFCDEVTIRSLPVRGSPDPFLDVLKERSADVVFTDAYPVDTAYQRAVRDQAPLAVLQDDARHPVCADLLVNGNLYAETLEYEVVGDPPRRCLGTAYVPLRSDVRELAAQEPPWRTEPERALVTMGGSDVANRTPAAIRAFDGVDLTVDAIVGPGFDDRQERAVRTAAAEVSADVRVHRDPDDLPTRMHRADLAMSTASSTTYELLALGTPIVCLPIADNQTPIARALADRDVATVLDRDADSGSIRRALETTVEDTELRRRRRDTGRDLVDGEGVARIHAELLSLVDENATT